MNTQLQPDAAAGYIKPAATVVSLPRHMRKRALARANSVSPRTVDNWLAQGCPHLKISDRLTLFDLEEVSAWLKQRFGVQRRAPAKRAIAVVQAQAVENGVVA